ncbi:hypothetical protein F2Q69_00020123 [Brassica cretica]|uniref:Uncharacterized protein n=1 Tax=Brassica cretica TaxID=69181 RepID=A0A8S9QP62_BRACR|nr:hypothetical protein F2Q69_00020123 [Brassica cretica]
MVNEEFLRPQPCTATRATKEPLGKIARAAHQEIQSKHIKEMVVSNKFIVDYTLATAPVDFWGRETGISVAATNTYDGVENRANANKSRALQINQESLYIVKATRLHILPMSALRVEVFL